MPRAARQNARRRRRAQLAALGALAARVPAATPESFKSVDSRGGQAGCSHASRRRRRRSRAGRELFDERDARVIRLRYGLEGKEPLTLKQIGHEVGLTRERVRQIEVEALRRLQQKITDERPLRFLRQMMQERTTDDGRDARPAPRSIPIQRRDARLG